MAMEVEGLAVERPAQAAAGSLLSARVLAVGIAWGALFAAINVYLGLKSGWWDTAGIAAAIGAYPLLAARRGGATPCDTVLAQTVASSAAVMPPAIGLLGYVPALEGMGYRPSLWLLVPWG